MTATATEDRRAQLAARRVIAACLAGALADPAGPLARRAARVDRTLVRTAWRELIDLFGRRATDTAGLGEIAPANVDPEPLLQWLHTPLNRRAETYQRVFGLMVSRLCPPYETEYCPSKDVHLRTQRMADIAGFYRAFGLEPGDAFPDRPDHVACELEFAALLIEKLDRLEQDPHAPAADVCRDALRAFLADHLVPWLPTFARCVQLRVAQLQPDPHAHEVHLFRGIADVLAAWITLERVLHNLPVRQPPHPPQITDDAEEASCHQNCPLA